MANKYKVKLNPQEPSSEQIARHQDFAALLQQFEQQPTEVATAPVVPLRARRLVYIASATAAAVLLLLVVLPVLQSNQPVDSDAYFAARPYIDPPALAVTTAHTSTYTVPVNQGGVYEYATGSRLIVPAAAFANDRGQLIGGDVTIHYRELHDHVDFFVGGIPMAYDSASVRYFLESGGMIEIYAEQNGERVALVPGKTIAVELISELVLPNPSLVNQFATYRLDAAARNWEYRKVALQTDLAPLLDSNDPQLTQWNDRRQDLEDSYRLEIAQLEAGINVPVEPVQPERATGERPTISLNFLDGNIELATGSDLTKDELQRLHEGAIWEISPQSPPINLQAFNVEWSQVRLRRLGGQNYQLTLINPQKEETLVIRPALSGSAYDRALDQYAVDRRAYEAALAQRDAQLADKRQDVDLRYAKMRQELETHIGEELGRFDRKEQRRLARRQVTHRFEADAFGIWQVARPVADKLTSHAARFLDEEGNEISNQTVYLADDTHNTVHRYLASTGSQIAYDTQAANLMWLVDAEGTVRVLRPAAFSKVTLDDGVYTFTLKQPVPPVQSEAELRAALSFE